MNGFLLAFLLIFGLLISLCIGFIILLILLFFKTDTDTSTKPVPTQKKPKPIQQMPERKKGSEYDDEGYNAQGYNEVGRNRQGKYNRYYNVKCYKNNSYSEEGFLNVRENPLYLTNHAQERMRERMNICDSHKMYTLAFEAYCFGKSKMQLMKSERGIVEAKEQEYGNSVILIYRGFCYVFTENNGLKTVFKNNNIRI